MNKKIITILMLLLSLFAVNCTAKTIESILAIVGDNVVTQTDSEDFKKKLKSGGLVDDALLRLVDARTLMKDKEARLQFMINQKILDSEVKRQNMSFTTEKLEKEIRSIAKRNNISIEQLKKAIREKGVRFSDYQNFIKTSLERQGLIDKEISQKIKISQEDISSYYMKNQGNTSNEIFQYTLAHILLSKKNGGFEKAKERAKKVLIQLQDSKSFEAIANKYSEDPNFSNGGHLGSFKKGEMVKEFDDAIKNLNSGDTTGIIKSSQGYHIIKVLQKTLVPSPQFVAQKNKIRSKMFADLFKKQLKNWLQKKRLETYIKINPS